MTETAEYKAIQAQRAKIVLRKQLAMKIFENKHMLWESRQRDRHTELLRRMALFYAVCVRAEERGLLSMRLQVYARDTALLKHSIEARVVELVTAATTSVLHTAMRACPDGTEKLVMPRNRACFGCSS